MIDRFRGMSNIRRERAVEEHGTFYGKDYGFGGTSGRTSSESMSADLAQHSSCICESHVCLVRGREVILVAGVSLMYFRDAVVSNHNPPLSMHPILK